MDTERKLILVSNREPFLIRRGTGGAVQTQRVTAGLVGALEPALRAAPTHWIAWSGFEREAPKESEPLPEHMTLPVSGRELSVTRIPLSEREASLYYYGFACRTLWPLLHLMLGRVHFDAEAWRAYKRVNQRFADAVLEAYHPGDRIWVHDHHLALVPALLRATLPDASIGFSWHAPFPPAEVFKALPWAREILEGLLGADQVGFQLPRYVQKLAAAAEEITDATVSFGDRAASIVQGGRTCRVGSYTSGCDFARWEDRARGARGGRVVRLRRNLVAERLALAVDRLDHTRGMAERLRAVERFFDRYPSWRGRLVFCQIAVPSRTRVEEYRGMKKEIDDLVERINTRFGQGSWVPVRYLYRSFEPDELAVYYASADVMLSTPLTDGVSFVPSEYLASRTREDGALLVSALSGAADAFPEATVVNPWDEEEVAGALHAALDAKPDDVRNRIRTLRDRARATDVREWLPEFWQDAFGDQPAVLREGYRPTTAPTKDEQVLQSAHV